MPIETEVAIVGGGRSGLALADGLQRAGVAFTLLEARKTLGGRIKRCDAGGQSCDLGPSWFWPGQPRMAALVRRFDLQVFEQYSDGAARFEDEAGDVQNHMGLASMAGSLRIIGGMSRLAAALEADLDAHCVLNEAEVVLIEQSGPHLTLAIADGRSVRANRVALCLPPRLSADITFAPGLPVQAIRALRCVPTRMAGQAKLFATYERPFWRDDGFSGDAISRRGPLVEIHDASPHDASAGALFGFVGTSPTARRQDPEGLKTAGVAQLVRLFGPAAAKPMNVVLQDWARDPYTSTSLDQQPPTGHPAYTLPAALQDLWGGRLLFGSTETAQVFGGFLEGALTRAAELVGELTQPRDAVVSVVG